MPEDKAAIEKNFKGDFPYVLRFDGLVTQSSGQMQM